MPKSSFLVFPHSERKRQNNPFQIITFHFHPFFSSLRLRFTVSYLPTFFPKQVYLYGVLSKNSVNRYWVAMAPLHRKRPSLGALGRLVIHGYTMLYTCLPLVSTCVPLVSYSPAFRMMCLVCLNSTQQQAQIPTAGDRTIQNLNMISFNGHASHGTIDNDITIKIAINTIQG